MHSNGFRFAYWFSQRSAGAFQTLLCDLGNREEKPRAFAKFRLHPNSSAVSLDHCFADCQTDAAAFELVQAVQALEQAEDFFGVFHVDTDTVVRDPEDPFGTVISRGDMNFRFLIAARLDSTLLSCTT